MFIKNHSTQILAINYNSGVSKLAESDIRRYIAIERYLREVEMKVI